MTDFLYYLTTQTDTDALAWFQAQHQDYWPGYDVFYADSPIDDKRMIIAQRWDGAELEQQPWYDTNKQSSAEAYALLGETWFPSPQGE